MEKEAKSPVVSIQSLQCGKTMTFENCHILLRTFNVHFLPRSVLFHQGFGTWKWSGFSDENQVHKSFSSSVSNLFIFWFGPCVSSNFFKFLIINSWRQPVCYSEHEKISFLFLVATTNLRKIVQIFQMFWSWLQLGVELIRYNAFCESAPLVTLQNV